MEEKLEIPVTKLQWGLRGAQIFFSLLAVFTISAVIGWDNYHFSASLLSVFFLFIILLSIFFSAAIVGIPHFYITKGKFKNAARALRIPRIEFVLSAIWAVLILIATALLSIDAYATRKCDPNDGSYDKYNMTGKKNETFFNGLKSVCRTQRASNAFGWFALTAWLLSLVLIANDWRKNRRPPAPEVPITYHNKPSNTSISSSVEEQTQETVQMQTIHPSPQQSQQPQQPQPQHYQFQQTTSPPFPHSPPFPQQQTYNSPPLAPSPGPMPPTGILMPQVPGPGQSPGQSPGQGSGISFPEPKHY